jgi:hypothetical protein
MSAPPQIIATRNAGKRMDLFTLALSWDGVV